MKKIGKAKIDLERDLWTTEREEQYFHMNRRLIDLRPDVKKFMAKFKKTFNEKRPSKRQPIIREAYFKNRDELRRQRNLFFGRVYKEIIEESFIYPIPLRKDHDFDSNSEWRFAMYKGIIYQFDRQGFSDEEMISQIEALESRGAAPAVKETGNNEQ